MIVCQHCQREMTPTTNGVLVVFAQTHVYSGDRYTCHRCGVEIIQANAAPYHCPATEIAKEPPHKVIRMD